MGIKRVLTSIVLIPVLYVIVWELPPVYFMGLVVVAAVIGQYEFYRMAGHRGIRPLAVLGVALGVLVSIAIDFYQPDFRGGRGGAFLVTFCVLLVTVVRLFSRRPVEGAIEDVSATLLGIFYVAMLFGFQMALRAGDHGRQWLMFMYLVIWASDTGAYYIGTSLGKHKLYPKISPKKSVEGLIGGSPPPAPRSCAAPGSFPLSVFWRPRSSVLSSRLRARSVILWSRFSREVSA